ncbi:hypothetical protein AFLA70_282g001300 [Aspergillus flavus AF70]|nr:hypothetical protein AFLA70_282g001300 [Aspergillus flavus AF70]
MGWRYLAITRVFNKDIELRSGIYYTV